MLDQLLPKTDIADVAFSCVQRMAPGDSAEFMPFDAISGKASWAADYPVHAHKPVSWLSMKVQAF